MELFKAYVTNPQQLTDKTIIILYREYMDIDEFEDIYSSHSLVEMAGILRDKLDEDHFTKCSIDFRMNFLRVICDYIAGISDKYALNQHELLFSNSE